MNKKAFTLVELLIATTILAVLIATSFAVYTGFFNSFRNIKAANLVYEEARFTMERIVKEIRKGTVDYEEYYNQVGGGGYGQNYCNYSRQFYTPGLDGQFGTYDDVSTGKRGSIAPIKNTIQNELYLIEVSGKNRTYIKLNKKDNLGKIAMLKLTGRDYGVDHIKSEGECKRDNGEGDDLIDTWLCDKGFKCKSTPSKNEKCTGKIDTVTNDSFVDITPAAVDIVDLKFIISPIDDPHKAYGMRTSQMQPSVTIKLTARANKKLTSKFEGNPPNIVLETTVSSRAYTEIITECNLQECIKEDVKQCPREDQLVQGASVKCAQGIWPVCTDQIYESKAAENVIALFKAGNSAAEGGGNQTQFDGLDHQSPFDFEGRTFYENTSEFGSCDTDECKNRRCNDGFDNDGNGAKDNEDPVCTFHLCNNGQKDNGETCIDVGESCGNTADVENTPELCSDGVDNDCSYDFDNFTVQQNINKGLGADEYDINCIQLACNNGEWDRGGFGDEYYEQPFHLIKKESKAGTWDEKCIDVGGLCKLVNQNEKTNENTDALCTDGLDNDCDYDSNKNTNGADEFDAECKNLICNNKKQDCGLAPSNYTPLNYLKGHTDESCSSDNDEKCVDAGGLCNTSVSKMEVCDDAGNLDENCNNLKQKDDDFCISSDGKSFFDNFSTLSYIQQYDTKALTGGNGLFIINTGTGGDVYSKEIPVTCTNIKSVTINHTATLKGSSSDIAYQLSNDGGNTWCGNNNCAGDLLTSSEIDINQNKVNFTKNGGKLMWKAKLRKDPTTPSPGVLLKDITITCD